MIENVPSSKSGRYKSRHTEGKTIICGVRLDTTVPHFNRFSMYFFLLRHTYSFLCCYVGKYSTLYPEDNRLYAVGSGGSQI